MWTILAGVVLISHPYSVSTSDCLCSVIGCHGDDPNGPPTYDLLDPYVGDSTTPSPFDGGGPYASQCAPMCTWGQRPCCRDFYTSCTDHKATSFWSLLDAQLSFGYVALLLKPANVSECACCRML